MRVYVCLCVGGILIFFVGVKVGGKVDVRWGKVDIDWGNMDVKRMSVG